MQAHLKRQDSYLLFLAFFLIPYTIQYVAAITPVIKLYFFTYYLYVLSFIQFPVYFSPPALVFFLISLAVFLIPAMILCLIVFINKFTKIIFSVLLPIGAVYLFIISQTANDPYLLLLTIYYWSIFLALIPVLIINFWVGRSKSEDIKKASIIAFFLTIIFMSMTIVFSHEQFIQIIEANQKDQQKLEELKTKVRISNPKYLPSRVGRKVGETISDKFPIYEYQSPLTAETYGVSQIYSCKGGRETSQDEFNLTEGLDSEQNYSLEEIFSVYSNIKEESQSVLLVEKVKLKNGSGIFILSQMQGASNGKSGVLFLTMGDKRIQIHLADKCVQDDSFIKEESIKIADSINTP